MPDDPSILPDLSRMSNGSVARLKARWMTTDALNAPTCIEMWVNEEKACGSLAVSLSHTYINTVFKALLTYRLQSIFFSAYLLASFYPVLQWSEPQRVVYCTQQ